MIEQATILTMTLGGGDQCSTAIVNIKNRDYGFFDHEKEAKDLANILYHKIPAATFQALIKELQVKLNWYKTEEKS